MNWLLAYLLVGFVIHWIGAQMLGFPPNKSWRWELAATILWPVTIVAALVVKRLARHEGE